MKPQIHVLFTSGLFQQVLAYIGSPKICMHACVQVCMHVSKSANLGLSNDVSMKKNDVHHIWVYPTMFRSEKPMISTLGGCPTMFRWKNQGSAHWEAVQRCFACLLYTSD